MGTAAAQVGSEKSILTRYLVVLTLLAGSALADFRTGLEAYQRGDYTAAYRNWKPLADRGDANAQFNVGLLYANGQGVGRDPVQAAEWYRKAAEQGQASAQYNLGLMYLYGEGVRKDGAAASKWMKMASAAGVGKALPNATGEGIRTCVMYDLGEGVQKDYKKALACYQQAAEQGNAKAYRNLGILYYNAQGTKRDLVQAYVWFKRASQAGDTLAPELLKATSSRMKQKDLRKAEELVARWRPGSGSAVASR